MEDKVALIELLNDVIFCWNLVKHNWFYTKFCVAHKFVAWYLNAALNSLQSKSLVWSKLMLVLTNLPLLGWVGRRLPANGALGSSEVPYIIYSLWSFQNKKMRNEWKWHKRVKNKEWNMEERHPPLLRVKILVIVKHLWQFLNVLNQNKMKLKNL